MPAACLSPALLAACLLLTAAAHGADIPESPPTAATATTGAANAAVRADDRLPWADVQDFEDARRGFVGSDEGLVLAAPSGRVLWDSKSFEAFLSGEAPATVNPSLWRHAVVNTIHGLFKVTDGLYQVRGRSLSNMTVAVGKTGYVVIDPGISREVAAANMRLVRRFLGDKPVVAVVYSHSHIDHFGGVKGVVEQADVAAGKVRIIAPEGFVEAALSENVIAGNAMARRALYMYGTLLPKSPTGLVDAGEGKAIELGERTLITPTDPVPASGKSFTVDGVTLDCRWSPGEAPVEMHVFLPQMRCLYVADNAVHGLHNVYTLRGARTRDCLAWAASLERALALPGIEVLAAGHNWPHFGAAAVRTYLTNQRDALRYLHDQTLRLANLGYTGAQIMDMVRLPPSLAGLWYLRNYYGDVRHDVRGIYDFYFGWYDGDPAHLNPPPPGESARKLVAYMGGPQAVLAKAERDFESGDYRFVAEVLDLVLRADPGNAGARELLAAALTQLGYQAEAATWRNVYLSGALELRNGGPVNPIADPASRDLIAAMPDELFFDTLAVHLNGPKAFGLSLSMAWQLTDSGEAFTVGVRNATLNHARGVSPAARVTVRMTRAAMLSLAAGPGDPEEWLKRMPVTIDGERQEFVTFLSLLDRFVPDFPLVGRHG